MAMVTIRVAHYPSRSPLMELEAEPGTTVGALRTKIQERLACEDECLVRVFSRWHLEIEACNSKRFMEITPEDEAASIESMGIEDFTVVYLEGPTAESLEGLGQALAVLSFQCRQAQCEQAARDTQMLDAQAQALAMQHRMAEGIRYLCRMIDPKPLKDAICAEADFGANVVVAEEDAEFVSILTAFGKQRLANSASSAQEASRWLAKYPNKPMQALWEALNDSSLNPPLLMAIVLSPICGIAKRSTKEDGKMIKNNWGAITFGATPLILASHANRLDVVKTLVAAGADVNEQDENPGSLFTPLHAAANSGNVAMMEFLLSKGANARTRASDNYTALHLACINGHTAAIEYLIANGADPKAKNSSGQTSLDFLDCFGKLKCAAGVVEPIRLLLAVK